MFNIRQHRSNLKPIFFRYFQNSRRLLLGRETRFSSHFDLFPVVEANVRSHGAYSTRLNAQAQGIFFDFGHSNTLTF